MTHWIDEAFFYHIYPLGFCGAPARNDFHSPDTPRLERLYEWIGHFHYLGINALYLGPVFESTSHGYDTADYYRVDRRLGNNETLARLVRTLHENGIRVVLDGVFNHVGRDFWAFRDVREHGEASAYRDWFYNLRFEGRSPHNDPFQYEGWNGHYSLVKLNLHNPAVKAHLLNAVAMWIDTLGIDGLRLDAADCVDIEFLRELSTFCRQRRPDFWLMGEIVHGDYRHWANPETLDSVTNYECYKGLYSSHNDQNYFEIAHSFNRQFGSEGIYQHLRLYNFVDNHDVNRVASILHNPVHLYPLYCLLMTMPGVPSIYYGSEWGIPGEKTNHSDAPLRPYLDSPLRVQSPHINLIQAIPQLAGIRRQSRALRLGSYTQLHINHQQIAFMRQWDGETVVVAVNAAEQPAPFELHLPEKVNGELADWLNPGDVFPVADGKTSIPVVWSNWARIMVLK